MNTFFFTLSVKCIYEYFNSSIRVLYFIYLYLNIILKQCLTFKKIFKNRFQKKGLRINLTREVNKSNQIKFLTYRHTLHIHKQLRDKES